MDFNDTETIGKQSSKILVPVTLQLITLLQTEISQLCWTELVREKYSSKSCDSIPVEFTSLSPRMVHSDVVVILDVSIRLDKELREQKF